MKMLIVSIAWTGHVLELAKTVAEGAPTAPGTESFLRRVAEFNSVNRWIDGKQEGRQSTLQ